MRDKPTKINKIHKLKVAVAVVEHEHYLVFQKRKRGFYQGYWGLLGGKIKREESANKAVLREVYEESGFSLEEVVAIGEVREILHNHELIIQTNLAVFYGRAVGNPQANFDEGELVWVNGYQFETLKDHFIPTDWLIASRTVIGRFKNFSTNIRKNGPKYEIIEVNF